MSWADILKDKEEGEVVDVITSKGKVIVTIRIADGEKIFLGDASKAGLPRDVDSYLQTE